MKTRFRFINFQENVSLFDEFDNAWAIHNNRSGDVIGMVTWDAEWRQWVFSTEHENAIFSSGCLRDIASFMDGLTLRSAERRECGETAKEKA